MQVTGIIAEYNPFHNGHLYLKIGEAEADAIRPSQFDELIETLTLAKLDIYKGQVIALNIDGFFNPLIALLDHYVETGMLDSRSRSLISFPQSVAELNDLLR